MVKYGIVQLKIHFEALFVRYLWLLVWHQYPPPETRPTLHNPLGLSLGLKSSLTSPQLGWKAAAIALPFWAKTDVMLQRPQRRKYTIFYEVRYVRYHQPKKFVSTHCSHTITLPWSSTVVTLTILSIKLQSLGPTHRPWYLCSQIHSHPAAATTCLSLLKRSSNAKRTVRNHCVLTILQFFYSPFFD